MKIAITIALSLFTLANILAQTSITNFQVIPYRQGRKWGYCDLNKKIIIPCKYDQVALFHQGLAAVTVNNKVGYIDQTGKLVIACKYGIAGDFNQNETAMVWNGNSDYDEPSARINKKGQTVQGKYSQWTNHPIYEPLFVDGMAIVFKENKYGYINENGNLVVPIQFDKAENFSEGFARVYDSNKGWAFINKSGKYMTPFEYIYYNNFRRGLAVINEINRSATDDVLRAGYIDNSFKKNYITGRGIRLHDYGDDLFLAEKNGKMGYVDRAGKVVIPFSYIPRDVGGDTYYGSAFINGVAIVAKNNKLGLINRRAEPVTLFIYEQIDYVKELDLFRCQWATPRSKYLESGYMSAQGVKYWSDKQTEISDYKQRALKNLASYNPPNKPANLAKTCSYAKMYLSNPKLYKWAGLAALVSGQVGEASKGNLAKIATWIANKRNIGPERIDAKTAEKLTKAILQGNENVYLDLYWQHLLAQEEGMAGIERAYTEKAISEQSYRGWVKILSAKNDNDIWEGNEALLYYEQSEILQKPMYDEYAEVWHIITNFWFGLGRETFLKNPVPPGKDLLFTEDDLRGQLTSIGDLDDRWDLIQRRILPSWRAFESNPTNRQILMQSLKKACPVLN